MKKMFICFIVFVLMVSLIMISSANGPSGMITIDSVEARPGEKITVGVNFDFSSSIVTLQMTPVFDATKLSLVKMEKSADFPGQFSFDDNITWFNSNQERCSGTAFTLTFTVLASAETGHVNISFSEFSFKDMDGKDVGVGVFPGTVTILKRDSENKEHETIHTSTDAMHKEVIIGDVDDDGKVTSGDARLALRASVKLENYEAGSAAFIASDVDSSGTIEASDARTILRVSVKLESFLLIQ